MTDLEKLVERVTIVEKRALVKSFLQREEVSRQIDEMGLSKEEVDATVAVLADEEVLQLAGKVERIPDAKASASAAGALSTTDGALVVIAFLLFLIYMSL